MWNICMSCIILYIYFFSNISCYYNCILFVICTQIMCKWIEVLHKKNLFLLIQIDATIKSSNRKQFFHLMQLFSVENCTAKHYSLKTTFSWNGNQHYKCDSDILTFPKYKQIINLHSTWSSWHYQLDNSLFKKRKKY